MIKLTSDNASPTGIGQRSAFPRLAAWLALAAPILAIGLSKVSNLLVLYQLTSFGKSVVLGSGLVSFVLLIAGLILGIVALLLMQPGSGRSVIFPAGAGVLWNGLLLAIFVPAFVHARSNAISEQKSLQRFNQAAQSLRQSDGKPVENAPTEKDSPSQAEPSVQPSPTTGDSVGGSPLALLNASSVYQQKLQTLQAGWAKALKELTAADVLRGKDLNEREDLQARKAVVQKFLNASDLAREFSKRGEDDYRNQLSEQKVSTDELAAAVNGFHNSNIAATPLLIEIHRANNLMGENMLSLLGLLDANWGQWRYDAATNRKVFKSAEVLQKYNASMQEIAQARKDQDTAWKKLLAAAGQPVAQP